MSSQYHRQALLKVLDGAYVSVSIVENQAALVENIIESHHISFNEKEFPFEDIMQNKTLHITVNFHDI